MNILYIVHDNKKGGTALSFHEMISYIRITNKVVVIVPHKHGYIPQELCKMGIEHHNAHFFGGGESFTASYTRVEMS